MHRRFSTRDENGFTLIEVVVATAILLIVGVASSAFTIQALNLAAQQQRSQIAVTVAGQRMEQVQRLTGSSAQPGVLAAGRPEDEVVAAFSAAAGVTGVAQTYPTWTSDGTEPIPLTATSPRSGSDFVSTVLIGTCYQPKAGGVCTTLAGKSSDPYPTAVAGQSRMIRVIVIVAYAGHCDGADTCRYTTSALFDTNADLTWQTD